MKRPSTLSVTDASRRGLSGLLKDAQDGYLVIERHGTPAGAVVSMAQLRQLTDAIESLSEAALVLSRAATDRGRRVGLDEVFAEFGVDRAELERELDEEPARETAADHTQP